MVNEASYCADEADNIPNDLRERLIMGVSAGISLRRVKAHWDKWDARLPRTRKRGRTKEPAMEPGRADEKREIATADERRLRTKKDEHEVLETGGKTEGRMVEWEAQDAILTKSSLGSALT